MTSMTHAVRALKVLAVFLLLGPPVGALTIFVGLGALALVQTDDLGGFAWITLFGLIYGVPLSYFIGIGPAAAAAIAMVVRASLGRPPSFLFAVATGAIIGATLNLIGGQTLASLAQRSLSESVSAVLLLLACVVATVACWAVTRSVAIPAARAG